MNPEEAITPDDLLNAMEFAGVLEVFCHLPEASRREFEMWIGKARDNEAHWRRIDSLVLAMRNAPANAEPSQPSVEPAPVTELTPRVRRVMVVDDDASARLLLKTFLEHEDAFEWVGEAASCPEAVELAGLLKPDLVTMDHDMPGGSGTECIVAIKALLPDVQILALSASDDATARTMVDAGAYARIDKAQLAVAMPALYEIVDRRNGDRRTGDRRQSGSDAEATEIRDSK